MNIIFLDYDGVVNTVWFDNVNKKPKFNFPDDNKVNNTQAIGWLNLLYTEIPYSIVVSSTWRSNEKYREFLYNAGLNKDIKILGKTDILHIERGKEIQKWLDDNKNLNIERFVILDDDIDMMHLSNHLIKTDAMIGLGYYEYVKVKNALKGECNEEC